MNIYSYSLVFTISEDERWLMHFHETQADFPADPGLHRAHRPRSPILEARDLHREARGCGEMGPSNGTKNGGFNGENGG